MVADKSTNTSSYTKLQALTLTHHLQTATVCKIPYWMPSEEVPGLSSQQHWGFIFMSTARHSNPFINNLCTLPCLLWFQYLAVPWAHAAPPNLVLPEKTDRNYYIFCDGRGDMKLKKKLKRKKVFILCHPFTVSKKIAKFLLYLEGALKKRSFTVCSMVTNRWHCGGK